MQYDNIPSEIISQVLGINLLSVLDKKTNMSFTPKELKVLDSMDKVDSKFNLPEATVFIKFLEMEASNLILRPVVGSVMGWGLQLKSELSTGELMLLDNSIIPNTSLRQLLVWMSLKKGIDLVFGLCSQANVHYKTTIPSVDGTSRKIELPILFEDLFRGLTVRNLSTTKKVFGEVFNTFVSMAQKDKDIQTLKELVADAGLPPLDYVKAKLREIALQFFTDHITGGTNVDGIKQPPTPIKVTLGGQKYKGKILLTENTLGTVYQLLENKKGELVTLFNGKQNSITCTSLSEFKKLSLLKNALPRLPDGLGDTASPAIWFLGEYTQLLGKIREPVKEDVKLWEVESLLTEAFTEQFLAYCGQTSRSPDLLGGVSFLDDVETYTMAKISKQAFEVFDINRPLDKVWKVFNLSILNHKALWALLYSSLIPAKNKPRKMALYLAGSGGSFKTTFISNTYGKMLDSQICTINSEFKIKPQPQGDSAYGCAKLSEVGKISQFGDDKNSNLMAKHWQEVSLYNVDLPSYKNLKEELGNTSINIEKKHVNGSIKVPNSKLTILDSNFQPVDTEYNKEHQDRLAEVFVLGQYFLFQNRVAEFKVNSTSSHLYFDRLLTEEDNVEAMLLVGKQYLRELVNSDVWDYWLPFSLFRAIMTYGRKCYIELLDRESEVSEISATTFSNLDPCKFQRKELAMGYILNTNFSNIGSARAHKNSVTTTPKTVVTTILRAGFSFEEGCLLDFDTLDGYISKITNIISTLMASSTTGHNAPAKGKLKDSYKTWIMQALGSKYYLGVGSECVDETLEGFRGIKLDGWLQEFIECSSTDTMELEKVKAGVRELLQTEYLAKLEANPELAFILKQKDLGGF